MQGKGKRTYHRGNVREDLLSAAEDILDTESLESITVRRLTSTIGVTPGNFYNHFENLNELLAHLGAKKLRAMSARTEAARNRHRKPILRLRAAAREFIHLAADQPQAYQLMFGHLVAALNQYPIYLDAAEDAFEASVNDLYGEPVYDRNDRKASHERCVHGYAMFALLNGLARDVIDGLVGFSSPEEIDQFTDAVLDSLLQGRAFRDLEHRLG
ncbi:MAG: TetR/AcrR family transcriptional regulator [Pseudomonadales bacterium]